jgi:hypothetical protein
MATKILQIASLQNKPIQADLCDVVGLALIEENGERRLEYIKHGPDGRPRLTQKDVTAC